MSMLWGFVAADSSQLVSRVVEAMGVALRVSEGQTLRTWSLPGVGVGLLTRTPDGDVVSEETWTIAEGAHRIFLAGEFFATRGRLANVEATDRLALGRCLLNEFAGGRFEIVRDLDGEFQLAFWNEATREFTLVLDRFASLPSYWACTGSGAAFAGGVRGVLMSPEVPAAPDADALREAVSFGGFRLGDRTNVAAIKMLPGAAIATFRRGVPSVRRYWTWGDIPEAPRASLSERIEEAHRLWKDAIVRRLKGSRRPGETLSGGLDSRAILAEAAPQAARYVTVTYGIPGCDDAVYGQRAAAAAGSTWVFHPLYSGREPDWLDLRTSHIQATDGLMELVDLMHLESLEIQASLMDVHLSGYVGDAVAGPTFNDVSTAEDVLQRLPYYGTPLGFSHRDALSIVTGLLGKRYREPRFALFDHKLPQATNRWTAAWRPYFTVRKPFLDHAFFDFFQGLPPAARGPQKLYERWLRQKYPSLFASIPNQKTGLPILAPAWRLNFERGRRFLARRLRGGLGHLGGPVGPGRIRNYHDDARQWRVPAVAERIRGAILRPGSLVCEILGRERVQTAVDSWFGHLAGPTQVIGALYVFEVYHRDLPAHLAQARRREA